MESVKNKNKKKNNKKPKLCYPKSGMFASTCTALFALSCCIAPFLMLVLGFSGAGLGILRALPPYRVDAIVMMIISLSYTFFVLYIQKPKLSYLGHLKKLYWVIVVLAIIVITLPLYEWMLY